MKKREYQHFKKYIDIKRVTPLGYFKKGIMEQLLCGLQLQERTSFFPSYQIEHVRKFVPLHVNTQNWSGNNF